MGYSRKYVYFPDGRTLLEIRRLKVNPEIQEVGNQKVEGLTSCLEIAWTKCEIQNM